MAKQMIVFALIFFAAVGMASAKAAAPSLAPTAAKAAAPSLAPTAAKATAPSLAPIAAAAGLAEGLAPSVATGELAEGPSGESQDDIIGTISGGTASDAAPIGGPVPDGVFPDLTPAHAPANGAAALEVTTVAGAIAAAGLAGSFFL